MKLRIGIGSTVDFVCAGRPYRNGKVAEIHPSTRTVVVEIAPLKTKFFIDFSELRRVHV